MKRGLAFRQSRGFIQISIVGAVLFLVALGAIAYVSVGQKNPETPLADTDTSDESDETSMPAVSPVQDVNNSPPSPAPVRPSQPSLGLRAEMEMALKSGGINAMRVAEIEREIDALATRGTDVADLRILLGKLAVGGSEKQKPPAQSSPPPQETVRVETKPYWEYNPSKPELGWYWAREGEPPECQEPLVMESPVEVGLATAILYPGQVRGDGPKDFKPHGGFTLKPGSPIEIKAPMDGYLTNVSRFTDEFGYHVSLIFQNPCGIQFGGGHWGTVPPEIQAVIDKVPVKGFGVSPTEPIIPPYFVKKGQVIVTGLQEKAHPERPGFDWGVADYRQPNTASKDPRFRELYGYAPWNTYFGVCWLDLLPPDQKAVLKSLPGGDGKQGKNSEYCK